MKAMIYVGQREVEYKLLRMAYDACSKQVSALSKALEMASIKIDSGVNSTAQMFAPTLSDFNPKLSPPHLDPVNAVAEL